MQDEAHTIRPRTASAAADGPPDLRAPATGPGGERRPRFPSPSGKIELTSATLARFGYDPLPGYHPPSQSPDGRHPLHLITGPRREAYINSQMRQVRSIARRGGPARARVHPATARTHGVQDGARVRITSPTGSVVVIAELTDRVRIDVVVVDAGDAEASANELTSIEVRDPISGFPAFRSGICRIEPVAE